MAEHTPNFVQRLALACGAFFRTLFNPRFANAMEGLRHRELEAAPTTLSLQRTQPDAALQLLGLLQQQGRLVDFLEEDIASYTDAEVGAAARVVHEGCRQTLHEHLTLTPVREEAEGTKVTLETGFDASRIRITGNVSGEPPFTGTLVHRGWQATAIELPQVVNGHDVRVLAPAEVEL